MAKRRRNPWRKVKETPRQMNPNIWRAYYRRKTDEELMSSRERLLSSLIEDVSEGLRLEEHECVEDFLHSCKAAYGCGRQMAALAAEIKRRRLAAPVAKQSKAAQSR